jgi:hypothetical protein
MGEGEATRALLGRTLGAARFTERIEGQLWEPLRRRSLDVARRDNDASTSPGAKPILQRLPWDDRARQTT